MSKSGEQLAEIYNLLCRCALNRDYYGASLHSTQRLNDVLEILIAVGATGSGVSALPLLKVEPYGKYIWGALTTVSVLLAVSKPIIQLNKKIERLTKLYVGHSDNYSNLLVTVSRIRRQGRVTPEFLEQVEDVEVRFVDLSKDDDPYPNEKRRNQCEAAVRKRHPPESAWYPPERSAQEADKETDKVQQAQALSVITLDPSSARTSP